MHLLHFFHFFFILRKYYLKRLTLIFPAHTHTSTASAEVAVALMCGRNKAFGLQKQLVSRHFPRAWRGGRPISYPSTGNVFWKRRAVGIPTGFHWTSGRRRWLYPSLSRRSKGQCSPAACCPWLSTPRRTTQRREIRINLKSDMLILTPVLPLFTRPTEKSCSRLWRGRVGSGWVRLWAKWKV